MAQRAFLIISKYIIRKLSRLYNPDRGYFCQNCRVREKVIGWKK